MSWFCRKSRAKQHRLYQAPMQLPATTKPIINEQFENTKSDKEIQSIKNPNLDKK